MAAQKNLFWHRIQNGEFIVSVQIDPPDSSEIAEFKKSTGTLKRCGVRLVDINSSRRISHDSIGLAVALSQMGLETIPHVTTRDSSMNGLLNQMIAAYAWGNVRNFLIITGDPYDNDKRKAVIPETKGVFHIDSIGALRVVNAYLRQEKGLDIKLAAAVNQNEPDLARDGWRIEEKERAGADFFMSQPVFSKAQLYQLLDFYHNHSAKPLLVGIWPLTHIKTIENIRNGNIVGVVLPDDVYEESKNYSKEQGTLLSWGMNNASELMSEIKEKQLAQGVYIVAPARNPASLTVLLRKFRG